MINLLIAKAKYFNLKLVFTLVLVLYFSFQHFGQEIISERGKENYIEINPLKGKRGFSTVDRWGMYPNGEKGIMEHLAENIVYPKKAKKKLIEGKVIVGYIVNIDGTVGDVKIIKGVHPLLDAEAIRVIKLMDRWKPAVQGGEKKAVPYQQTINFDL